MSRRNKSKKRQHEEENGEAWLLPYSDLMTLLLAVFIVLFAVSQIDKEKSQQMSEAFTDSMMTKTYAEAKADSQETAPPSTPEAESKPNASDVDNELEQMEALKAKLDAKLESENLTSSVKTGIDSRGLVVSLSNAIFFDSGSAQIKKENEKTLLDIAQIVNTMNNFIRIEGHTDNVPMKSEMYPSNWDLSAARAANVVQLFINEAGVSPEKLVAVGYGEYRPVADNSTEEGRAKNRRIDIIVLSEKYDDLEK
ncbi:MAG TPA: flagellar motor protein MotB [Bacillota bacterium]|nr:flagellar motor protein MotB [Bacillota bacterium]